MKLIVGLGNPGVKYETTRHNAGFLILDYYANKNGIEIKKIKNKALVGEAIINGEKVIFIKPQTFMNLSGDSVLSVAEYYGIDNEDIFIIYDDISLPLGKIRIRAKGSAGGHNGIKDIILKLDGDDFARLKIGVSSNGDKDLVDYVLGNFSKKEFDILKKVAEKSAEIIDSFVKYGVKHCMNEYNSFVVSRRIKMINHTVLWTLKDEALGNKKEENLILMKEKLLALKDKIDEIIEISVGINSVETPSSYDFILNVLFENKDDLDSYIVNKYHKEVGTFVREVVDKRVSIDYEV